MIDENEKKRISKFLSFVLRHKPEAIKLQLDENGWAPVDELIEKSMTRDLFLTPAILDQVVATNAKKRFVFNEDHTKIRASQGHSIAVDLALTEKQPPELLFHGTADRFTGVIKETGLLKQQRQHVHLSTDKQTAVAVGQRHGKPYIFTVMAAQMYRDGFRFYLSDNNVWLTDHVPARYLTG